MGKGSKEDVTWPVVLSEKNPVVLDYVSLGKVVAVRKHVKM